ncbi:MAG: PKD domain-containing protein [Candidatus Thermoplasmatota archaeon]|nr:PKD domain-containing protein [Candidatus Thermoplasmatota archaeon]
MMIPFFKGNRNKLLSTFMVTIFVLSLFSFGLGAVSYSSETASAWLPPEGTYVWNATEAASASNNSAWLPNGPIPEGADLIFNSTSVMNCAFDITTQVNSITLATGYTGTVTQASVVNVGAGGTLVQAGTLTGSISYWWINGGNVTHTGGTITADKLLLRMTGTDKTLSFIGTVTLYKIQILGTTTLNTNLRYFVELTVDGTLTISSEAMLSGRAFSPVPTISGMVNGEGTLRYWLHNSDLSANMSNVYCNVDVIGDFSQTANRVLTLTADAPGIKKLRMFSVGSTYTTGINTNNYNLTYSDLILDNRGIINLGTGTHYSSGSFNGVADGSQVIPGTSTVYLTGTGKTVELQAADSFYDLVVNGEYGMLSPLKVENSLELSGTLEQGGHDVEITSSLVNSLNVSGNFDGAIWLNGTSVTHLVHTTSFTGTVHSNRTTTFVHEHGSFKITPENWQNTTIDMTNTTDRRWTTNSDVDQLITFNHTGLLPMHEYLLYVDNVLTRLIRSDGLGRLQFTHAAWSSHDFRLVGIGAIDFGQYDIKVDIHHRESHHLRVQFSFDIPDLADAMITEVHWNFGDGTGSKKFSPIHQYERDGWYLVTVFVTDALGRTGHKTVQVEVGSPLSPPGPLEKLAWWLQTSFLTLMMIFLAGVLGTFAIVEVGRRHYGKVNPYVIAIFIIALVVSALIILEVEIWPPRI